LPLPKSRDNLEVIADKIEALAQVVAAHQNLAIRTGRAGADAVTIAKRSMTREQKVMYETWEQGLRMPAMDWKKNRKPVPANASDSGLYWTFALGIDHIWDHVGTTAENAAYVVSTWPQSLSLILTIDAMEMAEMQTAREIIEVIEERLNHYSKLMRDYSCRITKAQQIISARANDIKTK
ncbi:hypothetical protein CONLIGDRAFT_562713, partial [Coniochaeta ligniaria NRRL 30616]